jgi:PTS system galactitol-specific IIA component
MIARLCLERGLVKPSYEEALLQRENEYPTGLPIGDLNVAIPHTWPEHVLGQAVGVVTLKNPVRFQCMGMPDQTVDISVIVFLILQKLDDNVKMLPSLMDFFVVEENLKGLAACASSAEVMALLGRSV